jgi:hypothetical protein
MWPICTRTANTPDVAVQIAPAIGDHAKSEQARPVTSRKLVIDSSAFHPGSLTHCPEAGGSDALPPDCLCLFRLTTKAATAPAAVITGARAPRNVSTVDSPPPPLSTLIVITEGTTTTGCGDTEVGGEVWDGGLDCWLPGDVELLAGDVGGLD